MSKTFALFRALLSEGINPFRVSGKKQTKFAKYGVPIIVSLLVMFGMGVYGASIIEILSEVGMEYVGLTVFVVFAAVFTLMEGIYKASGLLFNCRDDDLVLALPIKKSTVLLMRMMKFYLFEVIVNALFLVPMMLVYGFTVGAGGSFYLVSVLALLILPIVPVVISCVIGGVTTFFSSKFKFKNLAQIVITTLFLLGMIYAWYNLGDISAAFVQNAGSINEALMNFYYPVGQYINLVLDFDVLDLLIFVVTGVGLLTLMVLVLGRVYYRINSRVKVVKSEAKKREYKVRSNRPIVALVKKEIGRFVSSPVFVINAGFGLVLYIVACVLICVNIDGLIGGVAGMGIEGLSAERIIDFLPAIAFGLIFVMSMMTSITSSMISLEGKSFNILKSLPVSPMKIILGKVLAAMMVMVPIFIVGDLMLFVRFGFDVWQILIILAISVIAPMIAELVGIIVNLRYPKMDAKDDVEVVKQSMSSMIAVFAGLFVSFVVIGVMGGAFMDGTSAMEVMGIGLALCVVVLALLLWYLKKRGTKEFNAINV